MNIPLAVRLAFSIAVPLLIVNRGYKKKSLNLSGALSSLVVGFVLTFTNFCFFSALLAFFVSGSFVTKLKADVKRNIEYDFKEGGQRNLVQVVCNGGVAVAASVLYLVDVGCREQPIDFAHEFNASIFSVAVLGSIACSSGDTWASEIGSVYGTSPRLITTLRLVPVGTNGGVTIVGTIASLVGGTIVGVAYYVTMVAIMTYDMTLDKYPSQWPIVVTGLLGGLIGSLIDSLIGAKLQYSGYCDVQRRIVHEPSSTTKHICGRAILSNHGVNFVSALLTGFVMPVVAYVVWKYV
ncbi:Transmembrane 19 [Paramuricea clavata]|uniref:Transmembrane protein 19 n=1 Tax=Paramuricea clavata TaxID=317549 RepID=A0A6S7HUN7_PARCT|nr:Transmembrane 19 [Paramuricea clavata]